MSWFIKPQSLSSDTGRNEFGTITWLDSSEVGGKWSWNGTYVNEQDTEQEQDWSSWIDNNPPLIRKENICLKHEWVDTGTRKTWCKLCDKSGRWELGNVVLEEK